VCAGTIETPISADERKAHGWTYDQWEKLKVQDVMLGRVGNTREIANATLFFACHESSYCTATHLMVVRFLEPPAAPFFRVPPPHLPTLAHAHAALPPSPPSACSPQDGGQTPCTVMEH
jgi:hypothetical protein